MTPDQARAKVDKLRAHAASVAGTPEAALFYAKADELAREHGLPLTEPAHPPRPTRARPASEPQSSTTTPTTRKATAMTNTTTKTKPSRKATDGTLRQAFSPRARAAFGRNTEPGTEITFYIVAIEEEPDLEYHTKAPKLDADGNERTIPILIIQTDGSTKPYGPGLRKLWVRTGVADALIGACLDAGVEQVAIGGTGRIRYDGLGEPPAPNFSAPKLYSAVYEPPDGQEVCR
ncbi:DUF2786 domain-containing protein [Nocardia terpenica]|uniref:DUF2786 domain-containing protein n=1 Tax=Nocardia terpenica TaxID=455432 RepID=A0A164MEK7_9NOCA|nr:DUF2786 domain-containing protein [Nocardia terpenica]KZM73290.1 hypothetical protein AWN90_32015 [Nocardia terpenica]NQE87560.1 DUF2786 domain-containing protein [Nocardia terpenica]